MSSLQGLLNPGNVYPVYSSPNFRAWEAGCPCYTPMEVQQGYFIPFQLIVPSVGSLVSWSLMDECTGQVYEMDNDVISVVCDETESPVNPSGGISIITYNGDAITAVPCGIYKPQFVFN